MSRESRDVTAETVEFITDRLGADLGDNFDAVIQDLRLRAEVGESKYGVRLYSYNGRDALIDLYEELLDALVYAVQYDMEAGDMGTSEDTVEAILSALNSTTLALSRRLTGGGFLRGRDSQPAPLFDRPIEQYL